MIAFEPGKTLSDLDLFAIRKYFATKWGVALNDTRITKTQSSMQTQSGTPSPPAKSTFTSVDATNLAVDGGSTTPFTMAMPPSLTNNTAMQLIPLSGNNCTLTTQIKFDIPWASSKTPGKFESMSGGLVLRDSKTGTIAAFGVHFQNDRSGGYRAYWFMPGATKNDSWLTPGYTPTSEQRKWYAADYRNVWFRLVWSPSQTTLLGSATGRVNEWDTLFVIDNAFNYAGTKYTINATHIGFYLDTVAPANFTDQGR
jgi:hypothetical protein